MSAQSFTLTQLGREITEQNIGLAFWCARRFGRKWSRFEDEIHEIAFLSLISAVAKYNRLRGVTFASFATMRIENDLRDLQVRLIRRVRHESGKLERDVTSSAARDLKAVDDGDFAEWALSHVASRHQSVCRSVWRDGLNVRETANHLGLTNGNASDRYYKGLSRVRNFVEPELMIP